jgi:hypothetical protein
VSEPTVVCVLGMHRSGTSLLTRALNLLGVDLGPEDHLMRPGPANPAGHWESLPMKQINDEILLRLGGSWSEPPELAEGWERTPELAEARRQARKLIDTDFSRSDTWGFKDPRNCLTLPFWQRMLPPMRYVLCLRNPIDVAASLEAREDEPIPFDDGIALWLRYVGASFEATAGHQRLLVFYEDLMANPGSVIQRLAEFIGRDESDLDAEGRSAIDAAVSESLWHHRTAVANVVDAPALAFHVKALYLALRLFVPSVQTIGPEVLDFFGAYVSEAGREAAELEATRAELEETREHSRVIERERGALARQLADRSTELERVTKERAEEGRLRHRLETELEATRAELSRRPEVPGPASPARRPEYERQIAEIRARAEELIPAEATVLVASKGDDALLQLDGARGVHFPSGLDGRYAGYHPSGDTAAIAHLEAMRAQGADHLLLPATTLWWLNQYQGLRRHLEERYEPLHEDEHCAIYRLRTGDHRHIPRPIAILRRTVASLRMRSGRDPSILDWDTNLGIADQLPELLIFSPPSDGATLPYLDGTVDVVVLPSADAARLAEARRVAGSAVITVDPSSPEGAGLDWVAGGSSGWGEEATVTLIPEGDAAVWDATLRAFSETLDDGFAGRLSVVGDASAIGRASEHAAAGVEVQPVEVPADASLARRARKAAKVADGRVQIFVTAPAVPLPDWLPSMLALFKRDQDVGVVGTRILSGDGTLEEAGGVLSADGSRTRRGSGDHDPDRPAYCCVRRVDFCSPPMLATTRDLFKRLGGFDERRAPTDALVDFSMRSRNTASRVYYQPQARVVAIGDAGR